MNESKKTNGNFLEIPIASFPKTKKETNNQEEFNWEKYSNGYLGGFKRVINNKIDTKSPHKKIYSHELYAQELFNIYDNNINGNIKKDLDCGDIISIIDIVNIRDEQISIILSSGLQIDVNLKREKKFIELFGISSINEFTEQLKNEDYKKSFLSNDIKCFVVENKPQLKISLFQGYIDGIKNEFMSQIKNPTKAYVAKIKEANKGGYFIEVQGIDAFMPGSLAAPNKIEDFKSYVGKEVIVMVEDYLTEIKSFIFSHKKYLQYILPQKLAGLDLNKFYSGTITGVSTFGIFIEFEEYFTGLIHNTKMKEETLKKFNSREFKPGDEFSFYISEITKDNRIILTEEDPKEKRQKLIKFIEETKNKSMEAKVLSVLKFGSIISLGEWVALVPMSEFKIKGLRVNNGDLINVKYKECSDDWKLTYNLA